MVWLICLMNALRLSIPPLPRFAGTARRAFGRFAHSHGMTSRDAESLTLALGEAVANAIQHSGSGEAIEIYVRRESEAIVATVSDRGRGFWAPPTEATRLPSLFAESGRGLAIMRRCTDFLEVASKPGRGTVVTLGRYCRNRQEPAAVS